MQKYNLLVCGGTFDHLHKGHEALLRFGQQNAGKLIVGITTDAYVKRYKKGEGIQSFEKREKELRLFLQNSNVEYQLLRIDDAYGKTLSKDFLFDALLVTKETEAVGRKITEKRKKMGLPDVALLMFPYTFAQDGQPISSKRIREGLIDRNGKMFLFTDLFVHKRYLPDSLRKTLKKPLGSFLSGKELKGKDVYTVGDIVTKTLKDFSISPCLSVVDLKVKRKKVFNSVLELGFEKEEVVRVKNEPATLTAELFTEVKAFFEKEKKRPLVILIDGEDDLAVLPILLCAPLGGVVVYGQPNEGMIGIEISEKEKEEAYRIVSQFITRGH